MPSMNVIASLRSANSSIFSQPFIIAVNSCHYVICLCSIQTMECRNYLNLGITPFANKSYLINHPWKDELRLAISGHEQTSWIDAELATAVHKVPYEQHPLQWQMSTNCHTLLPNLPPIQLIIEGKVITMQNIDKDQDGKGWFFWVD